MPSNTAQETLDRILGELNSGDTKRCLGAIEELHTLLFSSLAIVRALEHLAVHHEDEAVRTSARACLRNSIHRHVYKNNNKLNLAQRQQLVEEIGRWQVQRLLPDAIAQVISGRYDFDMGSPAAAQPEPQREPSPPPQPVTPPPAPAGPRPSLTQTLLSEASIRIYLYLGAFFVIASALILAAVVEAARLPILAAATLAFGGIAILLHRRLPQPSFALFIVFSFLLPIDANVLEETLGIAEPARSLYWTIVFLGMAAAWSFSTWFYESRFFSAVAFISLSLGFVRAGQILTDQPEAPIFFGVLAALTGLAGVWLLRKWKDHGFALPVFVLSQLQVLGLLALSFTLAVSYLFDSEPAGSWWLLTALTWLAATAFYGWSDALQPRFVFPWLAVGTLLPVPWFVLDAFGVTGPAYAITFWGWAALLTLPSEVARRPALEKRRAYHWPLLAGGAPLFVLSFVIAIWWEDPVLTFSLLAMTALVYIVLHLLHSRWYVWSAGLVSALLAYFALFSLPLVELLDVPAVYQLLFASLLLTVPELFTHSALSLPSRSRIPALTLGTMVLLLTISVASFDLDQPGRGALVLFICAVLVALHALHSRYHWLAYGATALAALAVVYASNRFGTNLWTPPLAALAVLYYGAGFLLQRNERSRPWGRVLTTSGLALGLVVSLLAFVFEARLGGWYIVLAAGLFTIELFARRMDRLEPIVEILLTLALYKLVDHPGRFLFGASLLWLGADLLFQRVLGPRRLGRQIVPATGYVLVLLSTLLALLEPAALEPLGYFLIYMLFFGMSAFLQRDARRGYLAAAALALAFVKLADLLLIVYWTFPLILLSALYYTAGVGLRRGERAPDWAEMLIYSGLGLGLVTSVAALSQGGLANSLPVAVAATLFAAEAFTRRNVWWALPANGLYLLSYFLLLRELSVDQPQFYSIGTALLGMVMHYLLTRAGSKTAAFVAGMLSQLVLLGTTYLQMVSTERLGFFFVLFVQSMLVLVYGLIQRSRSLVITPIAFAVLGVMTVIYSALKGLGPVILIGSTGIVLLAAGIIAVLMRERITRLGEQLSDWLP